MVAADLVQRSMYGRPGYSMRYSPYSYNPPCRYGPTASQSSYSPPTPSTYPNIHNNVEYGPYNGSNQGLSWSRTNSYSSSYSPYEAEATSPYTTQPPNFILPNNDPMANTNPYLVSSCANKTQSNHGWSDQGVPISHSHTTSQLLTAGYALPSSDPLLTYQNAHSSANSNYKNDQGMSYAALTNQQPSALTSDRTLPTPGIRNYASSAHTVSTLDSLPLSALSHRSSLGWQTDTSSSSSHVSSQTSCSSSGGSQDFGAADRGSILQRNSQDLAYGNYLGYANSPQPSLQSSTLNHIINDTQQGSQAAISNNLPSDLSSQRCRTISQESTSSNSAHHHQDSPSNTASSSYGYTGPSVTRGSLTRGMSGQLSNGAAYTRAQSSHTSGSTARRDIESEDFSGADCSTCQGGESRASISGVSELEECRGLPLQ